jgi:hypothetical protein
MIVVKPDDSSAVLKGSAQADAYVMGHGNTKLAVLRKEDLSAAEGFILVDLSDTTNFPHTETDKIRLYSITISAEKASDGQFRMLFGVITEVDDTNGSTAWLFSVELLTVHNPTDSTDRFFGQLKWPNGLDLEVDAANDKLYNVITNDGDDGQTTWQTDENLDSPVGDASSPAGDGDLVMYLEEPAGAGTISFSIAVEYTTEASA